MLNLVFWARYVLFLFVGSLSLSLGLASVNTEMADKVKAVCLYNFAKYVEWPSGAFESDTAPIQVCLVGDTGMTGILKARKDLKAKSRALSINKVAAPKSAAEVNSCHILYWNEEKDAVSKVVDDLEGKVLTVSDSSESSMVKFVLKKGKIKFKIRNDEVKRAGLSMSSQLLKLAVRD